MFSPDRKPHPAVSEIKYLQQPVLLFPAPECSVGGSIQVTVNVDSKATVRLHVRNRYSFRDLSHLSWSWMLHSSSSADSLGTGIFELSGQEQSSSNLQLDKVVQLIRQFYESHPNSSYFLNLRGSLNLATSWAAAGHVVVSQQFPIKFKLCNTLHGKVVTPALGETQATAIIIETSDDGNQIRVFRRMTTAGATDRQELGAIDKSTGALTSYSPHGTNILSSCRDGLMPNFVRAATDNDRGGLELALNFMLIPSWVQALYYSVVGYHDCSYWSRWKAVGLDGATYPKLTCQSISSSASSTKEVEIQALCTVRSCKSSLHLFDVKIAYRFHDDGRVEIANHVHPMAALKRIVSLPRIGMRLTLDPLLYNIQYYGRGPDENYPDRKAAAELGVYKTTPSAMAYLDYVFPVENGSRSDCEYIAFRANSGEGVCIASKRIDATSSLPATFSCSAQLHCTTELHDAMHTCDLERRSDGIHPIHVNIDHAMMGLGGDCR
jgi:beta-galactosidase